MSDRESVESHDVEDGEPRPAPPRDRSTMLKSGAFLALVGALILGAVCYWLLLGHTARFVAPVVCLGEYSAGYEVDQPVTNVAGRRIQDVYLSCLSEDGSRKPVGGLLIYATLSVEAFVVLFLLYLVLARRSLRGRPPNAGTG